MFESVLKVSFKASFWCVVGCLLVHHQLHNVPYIAGSHRILQKKTDLLGQAVQPRWQIPSQGTQLPPLSDSLSKMVAGKFKVRLMSTVIMKRTCTVGQYVYIMQFEYVYITTRNIPVQGPQTVGALDCHQHSHCRTVKAQSWRVPESETKTSLDCESATES